MKQGYGGDRYSYYQNPDDYSYSSNTKNKWETSANTNRNLITLNKNKRISEKGIKKETTILKENQKPKTSVTDKKGLENVAIDINNDNPQYIFPNSLANKNSIPNSRNSFNNLKKTCSSPFLQTVISKINHSQEISMSENSGNMGSIIKSNIADSDDKYYQTETLPVRPEQITSNNGNHFHQDTRSMLGTPYNSKNNQRGDPGNKFIFESLPPEESLSPFNPVNSRYRINSTQIIPNINPIFASNQQRSYHYQNQIEFINPPQHQQHLQPSICLPQSFNKNRFNNFNPFININNAISNINNQTNNNNYEYPWLTNQAPTNMFIETSNNYSNTSTKPNSSSNSVKEDPHCNNIYNRKYSCNSVNGSNSVKYIKNNIKGNTNMDINSHINMINRKSYPVEETLENAIKMDPQNKIQANSNYFNKNNSHNLERHKSNSHAHFKSNLVHNKKPSSPLNFTNSNVQSYNINNSFFQNDDVILENTEIMTLQIKTKNGIKIFSICRFDDLLSKIKSFCETHRIPEIYLDSIVNTISQALDSIFNIYNSSLTMRDVDYLNSLHILWQDVKRKEKASGWEYNQKENICNLDEMEDENVLSISFDERLSYEVESLEEFDKAATKYNFKFSKIK